jgi:hypothetical protein
VAKVLDPVVQVVQDYPQALPELLLLVAAVVVVVVITNKAVRVVLEVVVQATS